MRSPRHKRGARNRQLDPLLARALARLNAHLADPANPISQSELAARSGISQGNISRILDGKRPEVSFYVFARLVMAAGLNLDWILREAPPAQNDVTPWPVPAVQT